MGLVYDAFLNISGYLLGLLHGCCTEQCGTHLLLTSVLGSSLSSGAARRCQRIRHEAPEDGIRDAPLEASQRFLARLALCDLLAVVGASPGVGPGLAGGDHVQGVVEVSVAGQRELMAHHLPAL